MARRRSFRSFPTLRRLDERIVPALIGWDGGGGNLEFTNPLNWDTNTLPGPGDEAGISSAITAGPISVSQAIEIGRLNSQVFIVVAEGGTLRINGLPPSGSSAPTITVEQGGTLDLVNTFYHTFGGGTINNYGSVRLGGPNLYMNVSTFTNWQTGHVTVLGDAVEGNALCDFFGTFINHGYLDFTCNDAAKSARMIFHLNPQNAADGTIRSLPGAGGTRSMAGTLDNLGTMKIDASFTMDGTGVLNSGSGAVEIAAGQTLATKTSVIQPATLSGSGALRVDNYLGFNSDLTLVPGGVTLDLSQGSCNIAGPGKLTVQSSLTLAVNDNVSTSLSLEGALHVYGANLISGAFANKAGSQITLTGRNAYGSASLTLSNSFTNNGQLDMTSSDGVHDCFVTINNSGTFTNAPGASLRGLAGAGGERRISGTLNNQGAIYNSAAALRFFRTTGDHGSSGTINVAAGQVSINASGVGNFNVTAGSVTIANGATLLVQSGDYWQTSGATVNNGTLSAGFYGIQIIGGTFSGNGTLSSQSYIGGTLSPGSSPGKVTVDGIFGMYASGTLTLELNGPNAGNDFDQIKVNGPVTLGGSASVTIGYAAQVGDSFTVIDNDGGDSVTGTFTGVPHLGTFKVGLYTLEANYKGGTGNDVVLKVTKIDPPTATSVTFGDGTNQRSLVKQIVVTFSEAVNFSPDVASAFTLTRTGTGGSTGNVGLIANPATGPASSVTITFSSFSEFDSLVDGFYDFMINAAQVSGTGGALDGNNDSIPGGSYSVVGTTTNKFFRLYGDADGSGVTDLGDFAAFRGVFNLGPSTIFDFDDDNNVGLGDFARFRGNFNLTP